MAEEPKEIQPPPAAEAALVSPSTEWRPVRHLELKAVALLLAFLLLLFGSAAYLMYARGVFEPKQTLLMEAKDVEGITIGMDMLFGGFPIGRVSKTELTEDGSVRIEVEVPLKDAKWLRTSSIATLEKGLMGGAKLRLFTNDLQSDYLKDRAQIALLSGDLTKDLPEVLLRARDLLDNVVMLTGRDGALAKTLTDVQGVTGRLSGERGLIGGLMGNEADARKLVQTVESANQLLRQLSQLTGKADAQVFGQSGVVPGVQQSVREVNAMLVAARESLKKVDQVLQDATVISGNAKAASGDLDGLRSEVEASLRKVDRLITDLNRKWPFAPEHKEIQLP